MTRRQFINRLMQLMSSIAIAPAAQAACPTSQLAPQPVSLNNGVISAHWSNNCGSFLPQSLTHQLLGSTPLPEPFELLMRDGTRLAPSTMHATIIKQQADSVIIDFSDLKSGLIVRWQAILKPNQPYLRQICTIQAKQDTDMIQVYLINANMDGAQPTGSVKGCPLKTANAFYGFEHPLALHAIQSKTVQAHLPRTLPLKKGNSVTYSSVIGFYRPGQIRRDFLNYIEQERAHAYRPFLHYNSWYDIGFADHPFDEKDALGVVETLKEKGLPLKSYLMDDGWDDPKTLWGFHKGFPRGFKRVAEAAKKAGSALGVWMSPWGGYGNEKAERMKYGKTQGFEMNEGGFALSGPKYYKRFRDTCLKMIRDYGVNQFKIDGMGNIDSAIAGSRFDSDFDAAMSLIQEIRTAEPEIYVNLTYGTFPSPFWLFHADSIWRGGKDHEYAGKGTKRQQWITYRDADTYANVVQKSQLFPLNSLMLHGIIFAKHTTHLKSDPFGDFEEEVRSFFGSGTQLQELYITPALLNDRHWAQLKEGIAFAKRFEPLMKDTHWVGGDPAQSHIYGWACYDENRQEGLVTLRNPHNAEQSAPIDVAMALELPKGSASEWIAEPLWADKPSEPRLAEKWVSGTQNSVTLKPFEVQSWHCYRKDKIAQKL
ncbi:MAG: hypothetical protein MRY32_07310 [Rickettsiales bacterium]|nr:hypothetical protein [Rickettsiales bacterium]